MWTVDDEIRDEMTALTKKCTFDDAWFEKVLAVLTRAEEMIYKESNILFPICALNFATEEWYRIYHDSKDYADCMGIVAMFGQRLRNMRRQCSIRSQKVKLLKMPHHRLITMKS